MKKIAFISAWLMLFAFGKTWAQGEVHVFADNAFLVEIFNGDPASTTQMTDFGAMPVGSPDFEHVFTIQNQGIFDLNITNVTVTPGVNFAVDFVPSGPLPPFLPTTLAVTFSFSTAPVGIYDATVTIESNDPNSPFTFGLRAEVTAPPHPFSLK
ncbi:MAG: DUF1573 domain-containing protein [Saprospiraceae bacterium]|nr:DUF1573 domain-containing protein [Saprospiraceae bacterium]